MTDMPRSMIHMLCLMARIPRPMMRMHAIPHGRAMQDVEEEPVRLDSLDPSGWGFSQAEIGPGAGSGCGEGSGVG